MIQLARQLDPAWGPRALALIRRLRAGRAGWYRTAVALRASVAALTRERDQLARDKADLMRVWDQVEGEAQEAHDRAERLALLLWARTYGWNLTQVIDLERGRVVTWVWCRDGEKVESPADETGLPTATADLYRRWRRERRRQERPAAEVQIQAPAGRAAPAAGGT